MNLLIVFVLSLGCAKASNEMDKVIVTAPAGVFIGKKETISREGVIKSPISVSSFLGIPYAEPPVGNLRFSKPTAKAVLNETFDATEYGAMCIQGTSSLVLKQEMSEDCLFLNIFTKSNKEQNGTAVLVFIHGGLIHKDRNYREGGSNFYPGDVLAAYGSITVVTINYRLWIMGFFSRGHEPYYGNNGLWDQHLALQWVHDNIAAFGGDPGRVTLAGQHTGAVCAVYQSMYPGNKGLFQQVIVQSGGPFSVSVPNTGPFYTKPSVLTLYEFGCSIGKTVEEEVECMRTTVDTEAYEPNGTMKYWFEFRTGASPDVSPIVDGEFIKADPRVMLDNRNKQYKDVQYFFSSLNMLIGYNSMDGLSHLLTLWVNKFHFWDLQMHDTDTETYKISHEMFKYAVNTTLSKDIFEYENHVKEDVRDKLLNRYTNLVDQDDQRDLFLQYLTDYIYMAPTLNLVNTRKELLQPEHKDGSGPQTFLYKFTAQSGYKYRTRPTPGWATGANNGDELPFLFGFSSGMLDSLGVSNRSEPSDAENVLARRVMRHWSYFVSTGNPKMSTIDVPLSDWPQCFGPNDNLTYLELSLNMNTSASVKTNFGWPNSKFWRELQPNIYDPELTSGTERLGFGLEGLHILLMCVMIVVNLI